MWPFKNRDVEPEPEPEPTSKELAACRKVLACIKSKEADAKIVVDPLTYETPRDSLDSQLRVEPTADGWRFIVFQHNECRLLKVSDEHALGLAVHIASLLRMTTVEARPCE